MGWRRGRDDGQAHFYSHSDKSLLDFLMKVILYAFREKPTILSEPKLKGNATIPESKTH